MQTREQTIDMYDSSSQAEVTKALDGAIIVYSAYETGSYEGGWLLAYIDKDGQLWCDQGGHCSCYGPEFSPSKITPEELMKQEPYLVSLDEMRAAVLARFPGCAQ